MDISNGDSSETSDSYKSQNISAAHCFFKKGVLQWLNIMLKALIRKKS